MNIKSSIDQEKIKKYSNETLNEIKGVNLNEWEDESITDEDFVDENLGLINPNQPNDESEFYDDDMDID